MRVLVVGNQGDDDAGFVGERLVELGATLVPLTRESCSTWPGLDEADLVVVLGSEWSVYSDQHRGVVAIEATLLRHAHEQGVPILGICYGAQMLAHALGGTVRRASEPEVGWYDIDTVRPELIPPGPWFQWHLDTFEPPPGAAVLAHSPIGPQAFVADRTVAVQFHPEVDEAIVARWCEGGAADLAAVNRTAEDVVRATADRAEISREQARDLVDVFLAGELTDA